MNSVWDVTANLNGNIRLMRIYLVLGANENEAIAAAHAEFALMRKHGDIFPGDWTSPEVKITVKRAGTY